MLARPRWIPKPPQRRRCGLPPLITIQACFFLFPRWCGCWTAGLCVRIRRASAKAANSFPARFSLLQASHTTSSPSSHPFPNSYLHPPPALLYLPNRSSCAGGIPRRRYRFRFAVALVLLCSPDFYYCELLSSCEALRWIRC